MIPQGTRFIGISPNVNLTERRSAMINAETQPYTLEDIRGYKVMTALLTQSGGDNTITISVDPVVDLIIGTSYTITEVYNFPGDFTNVGAPNNDVGTSFIATGTTPNYWGKTELTYNTGAPVAKVLDNTLESRVWFEFDGDGTYYAIFDSYIFFDENEYVTITGNFSVPSEGLDMSTIQARPVFFNVLEITSLHNGAFENDIIGNEVPCVLEIRKYE